MYIHEWDVPCVSTNPELLAMLAQCESQAEMDEVIAMFEQTVSNFQLGARDE